MGVGGKARVVIFKGNTHTHTQRQRVIQLEIQAGRRACSRTDSSHFSWHKQVRRSEAARAELCSARAEEKQQISVCAVRRGHRAADPRLHQGPLLRGRPHPDASADGRGESKSPQSDLLLTERLTSPPQKVLHTHPQLVILSVLHCYSFSSLFTLFVILVF